MLCAIHQPNLAPWIPYFKKIVSSDIFIILTEAQFSRTYYQQRFNLDGKFYTLPVVYGNVPISQKRYLNAKKDWDALKRKLNGIYREEKYGDVLSVFDDCIYDTMCETNVAIIFRACTLFGIDTGKIRFDVPTELVQTERLVHLCRLYGCDEYLSGTGAHSYIDESLFEDAGIKLKFQTVNDCDKIPLVVALKKGMKL